MLIVKPVLNAVEVREESETGKLLAVFPYDAHAADPKDDAWDRAIEYTLLLANHRKTAGINEFIEEHHT